LQLRSKKFQKFPFDDLINGDPPMLKELTLSEHIHQHCHESMEHALFAERHPVWARSCPELTDIDFVGLGLLRCISAVDSGRHFLQTNEDIHGQLLPPCVRIVVASNI
jgi:hypothetical protein